MYLLGGYKEGGKYVYHYEAYLNPATIPNLETQLAKLYLNGTVELHIKPSEKAILQVCSFPSMQFCHSCTQKLYPRESQLLM